MCLPSLLAFTSLLRIIFAVLQKPCRGNFREISTVRLVVLKKIVFFEDFKMAGDDYKRGKLVSYLLDNAAKTCLYGLKI